MLKTCVSLFLCAALASSAGAQERRDCDSYARDYAAVIAPRTAASTLRNSVNGYPMPSGTTGPRTQTSQQSEWANMQPNQNAYRRGYEDCMMRNNLR